MGKIVEKTGNIFNSKCQTIVNTVNSVGVMGKGLALEFRLRYPHMYELYREYCKKEMIEPGKLFLYKRSKPWILNFPTKLHWKDPSKLEYIEKGLNKFTISYKDKGINSIAFPQLGTLNGKLDWNDVKNLMYKYLDKLEKLDVIEIYIYSPEEKDVLLEKIEDLINTKAASSELKISDYVLESLQNRFNKEKIKRLSDILKVKNIGKNKLHHLIESAEKEYNREEEDAEEQLMLF